MTLKRVIYFDGVCNLCDGFISTLFFLGLKEPMKVASLQGEYAKDHLPQSLRESLSSVVYQREEELLFESHAVIAILSDLKWYFKPLKIALIIPKAWRDGLYKWVAKNRYKLFGKKETCRLPSPSEREFFLP